ncbi:MAG TPA: metallophosphoesterase [Bryobacteraceae bacterium]|nr:metallophosphoesterase [Bryobacteraceae bacterium]
MKVSTLFLFAVLAAAQTNPQPARHASAADLPTDKLLSEAGPTFRVDDRSLPSPLTVITYGDQRFTDPANVKATNPRVRRWLVGRIAEEKPGALVLNGDVPLAGDVKNDYEVYKQETQPWRDAHLNVYQALGNHEFHGDPAQCLENWWNAFPALRNRRWYSVQLGSRAYIIALDSDTWLTPGSDQARWLDGQLRDLPRSVDVVFISMHHPPVADVQTHIEVDHNPRQNEIALRDYLSRAAAKCHAHIIVSAGHIHNYERHIVDNVTYLVSGGGGATPYFVERTRDDLYQSTLFPNYHYVKFTVGAEKIHGEMYRVSNPDAVSLEVELKDQFDIALDGR